jgi:hypothetical protein
VEALPFLFVIGLLYLDISLFAGRNSAWKCFHIQYVALVGGFGTSALDGANRAEDSCISAIGTYSSAVRVSSA